MPKDDPAGYLPSVKTARKGAKGKKKPKGKKTNPFSKVVK